MKKVCVGMATYPKREDVVIHTLSSLVDQNCNICVYLNEYSELPSWTQSYYFRNVSFTLGKDAFGNIGDAAKFYSFWDNESDYFLPVDDDVLYPKDYVVTMIHYIEHFNKEAVVCVHGRKFGETCTPIQGYFKDYHKDTKLFHFLQGHLGLNRVHVPGTGSSGFHRNLKKVIPYAQLMYGERNQADIHFAIAHLKNETPMYSIPRSSNWLSDLSAKSESGSIYDDTVISDLPKELLNKYLGNNFQLPKDH